MIVLVVCLNEVGAPDSFVLTNRGAVVWAGRSDTVTASFLDDFGSAEMTMSVNVRPWINVYTSLCNAERVPDPPLVVVVFRNRRFNTMREWKVLYSALQRCAKSKNDVLECADRAAAVGVYYDGGYCAIRT